MTDRLGESDTGEDVFGRAVGRPPDPRPGDAVAEIVVVCHANIARSPLAMAMLDAEARRRLGSRPNVWVRSAGVHAREGQPAAQESLQQAAVRGLDLSRHRSSLLRRDDVERADLVITMTERQRAHAVHLHPPASRWVFTLPELARLCRALKPVVRDGPVRERVRFVARLAAGARPYVNRPSTAEDVADPYGGPRAGYAAMAEILEEHVEAVATQVFGAGEPARR